MESYDQIGQNYNQTRIADLRITSKIISLLDCKENAVIADIGAGTGNYSYELAKKNYIVLAVEPAETMLKQRRNHKNLKWQKGFAENIPLKTQSVDGVICTLAVHHFKSIPKFISEAKRILKPNGKLVMFTFDPRLLKSNDWIKEYFPDAHRKALNSVSSQKTMIKTLKHEFNSIVQITEFKLPPDLTDSFFYAGWKCPEKYLDADFRKGISVFALGNQDEINIAVNKLKIALKNGAWDKKHKLIRTLNEYSAGYYFLNVDKKH